MLLPKNRGAEINVIQQDALSFKVDDKTGFCDFETGDAWLLAICAHVKSPDNSHMGLDSLNVPAIWASAILSPSQTFILRLIGSR